MSDKIKADLSNLRAEKIDDDKVLLTTEKSSLVVDPIDEAVHDPDQQYIEITSKEQLEAIAEACVATKKAFDEQITELPKEKAEFVKNLRCVLGYTWRAVARACYEEWGGNWFPPSNQLMGMTLCERAAEALGEDPYTDPWN